MNYTITNKNIHIEDSYKIRNKDKMRETITEIIDYVIQNKIECEVLKYRTVNEIIEEWRAHNLLYDLHLFRSHTKDVDIDMPSELMRIMFKIVSFFYIG